MTDEAAMRLAMAHAQAARAAGEVPVGAVLVRDGQVIATGANAPVALADPTAHAEMVALRAAASAAGNYRLDGCTLYVTLEPCPMCAGALLHARVARVVFAAADPRTGAAGSVVNLFDEPLLNHHTRVEGGLLAGECGAMLQDFFRERRAAQARVAQPLREDALRTPRNAFEVDGAAAWEGAYTHDLPALAGLRLHHVELGDERAATVFICLHGAGDWGVRFAAIAASLAGYGVRVLVPDLIGFGRSDKPKRGDLHRLDWHVQVLRAWCESLGLRRVVLLAEAAEADLCVALWSALGAQAAGIVLLPTVERDEARSHLAALPFPDRGHTAGPRAFADGWKPQAGAVTRTIPVLHLESEGPEALARAVEYFAA
ncbi:tRNA adenosine(34) deaminase TadA [Xylophilus sp. GOD-11R]|uniref:tRNA adenosine(34) deaminase TadA n=1 Tax=Xylophilus sp. GOD-11R TaxID=3089814 RepID=UPI00298C5B59|nr:tRNA adenosine(34) deaminase TadA [Xylophilus sp. GOD-11R]WPB59178.1 tRNA adenosine(34) deaminase TadA [Xylophilus sp. GOD-11R]